MNKRIVTSAMSALGIALLVSAPVYACGSKQPQPQPAPVGSITKSVENVSTNSALSNANNVTTAVAVKTGDTVEYVVVISNNGQPGSNNAMVNTVLTDNLPSGIELTSNSSQRTITDNIGSIQAGSKVTEQYQAKVTATQSGPIENEACYTADNTQNGSLPRACDAAYINVTIPPVVVPVKPVSTPPVATTTAVTTPAPNVTQAAPAAAPTALVNTGPGSFVPVLVLTTIAGYIASVIFKKRQLSKSL